MRFFDIVNSINSVAYKDLETAEKMLDVLNFFTGNNYRFLNRRLVVFNDVDQQYHDAYAIAKDFEDNF